MQAAIDWLAPGIGVLGLGMLVGGHGRSLARRRLSSGGPPSRSRLVVPTTLVAGSAIALLVRTLSPVLLLVGLAIVVVGWVAGRQRHRRRAQRSVGAALVPVLDELARGLRGGLTPVVALEGAIDAEFPEPSSADRGLRSHGRIAAPELEVQLARWQHRASNPLVDEVAAQLRLGQRLSGLHPEFVTAISQMVMEQRQLGDEIDAQSSQARASAVVMTVAPLLFFAALVLTDERASQLMLRTSLGAVLLTVGLSLDVAAYVWMRRITDRVMGVR
jgi:Flp pilus assembly protein TadB